MEALLFIFAYYSHLVVRGFKEESSHFWGIGTPESKVSAMISFVEAACGGFSMPVRANVCLCIIAHVLGVSVQMYDSMAFWTDDLGFLWSISKTVLGKILSYVLIHGGKEVY